MSGPDIPNIRDVTQRPDAWAAMDAAQLEIFRHDNRRMRDRLELIAKIANPAVEGCERERLAVVQLFASQKPKPPDGNFWRSAEPDDD